MAKINENNIKKEQELNNVPVSKSNDADMPKPQTQEYKTVLRLNDNFISLFNISISNMPYSTILTNSNNEKIKLIDIVKFVEQKRNSITVDELNIVIGFMAGAPFKYVRPLMEIVENPDKQKTLWDEITN